MTPATHLIDFPQHGTVLLVLPLQVLPQLAQLPQHGLHLGAPRALLEAGAALRVAPTPCPQAGGGSATLEPALPSSLHPPRELGGLSSSGAAAC